MQCPHCAHTEYILCGTSRGVKRCRCQACRRIVQTGFRDPSQDGLSLDSTSCQNTSQAHHRPEACSFIEIDELCAFIAKKNPNVGSG